MTVHAWFVLIHGILVDNVVGPQFSLVVPISVCYFQTMKVDEIYVHSNY